MLIEKVGFEELDINRWNGSVHYAINGNVFGYHWYLRSVIKEWDALIIGDYQEIMQIPRHRLTPFQLSLMPEMGYYSNISITPQNIITFIDEWLGKGIKYGYAFNTLMNEVIRKDSRLSLQENIALDIFLGVEYEEIYQNYNEVICQTLQNIDTSDFEIGGHSKPEVICASGKLTDEELHIYHRLMYNALHRSAGFHLSVRSKKTQRMSDAFFLQDRDKLVPIYLSKESDLETFVVLIDLVIRQSIGKPISIYVPPMFVKHFGLFGGREIRLLQIKL